MGSNRTRNSQLGSYSVTILLLLAVGVALVPVAFFGWSNFYNRFMETAPPLIEVSHFPRGGIGRAPVKAVFNLSDEGSGLDEVVVRTKQKDARKEIFRQSLSGRKTAEVALEFAGVDSKFEEGEVLLEIKAFDRSFWSNRGEGIYPLVVDYRKPDLNVKSLQHNARFGGTQLLFYSAYDENLTLSGVKVGSDTFAGFPARGLDPDFEDPKMHVVLYAVGLKQKRQGLDVRVFAEDKVGNGSTQEFYNKVLPRRQQRRNIKLSDAYLRSQVLDSLGRTFLPQLEEWARTTGQNFAFQTPVGSRERLIETFQLMNNQGRMLSDITVRKLLKRHRLDKLWQDVFLVPRGTVTISFGDRLNYLSQGELIGTLVCQGYYIRPLHGVIEVLAANDGIVAFAENIGVYGTALGIDHGLGLFSIYGQLQRVVVNVGEKVIQGQHIAEIGSSVETGQTGLARGKELFFQMRVGGVPVDAREFWDASWYYSHVTNKTNDVKMSLGLPVRRGVFR